MVQYLVVSKCIVIYGYLCMCCVCGTMRKTKTLSLGVEPDSAPQISVAPVCVPKDDTKQRGVLSFPLRIPSKHILKDLQVCVKEYGHLSDLKRLISAIDLILKWTRVSEDCFQTLLNSACYVVMMEWALSRNRRKASWYRSKKGKEIWGPPQLYPLIGKVTYLTVLSSGPH